MQASPSLVGSNLLPILADFGCGADLFGLISLNINKIPSVFPGLGMSPQNHVPFSSFQLGAFAGSSWIWNNRPYCDSQQCAPQNARVLCFPEDTSGWGLLTYGAKFSIFSFLPIICLWLMVSYFPRQVYKSLSKIMLPLRCCPYCILTATLP